MIPLPFPPLANHLWQSTLFAVVAALLTLLLRKNRAQTRYWVWLAASVKFLVPFSLLTQAGNFVGRHETPVPVSSSLPYVIQQASQPFTPAVLPVRIQMPAGITAVNWIPSVLIALWIIGAAMLVCFWWRRWQVIRSTLRTAAPLDLDVGIPTLTSPAFAEPGVFGLWRPVLLLPLGITDRLTPSQLNAIVAHEVCHIRRRDNLATAIHMAVEALFWFHPLVWWLGARLMQERERSCDEEVLLTGNQPEAYAEGILQICELYLESPLPCVSGVTGANLKKRIEEIMTNRIGLGMSFAGKIALAATAAVAIAAPILTGVLNAPAIKAQTAPPGTPRFEVASIKPCKIEPNTLRRGGDSSPGRLSEGCDLLADDNGLGIIHRAYVVFAGGHPNPNWPIPIKGGPRWIHTDMYRIDAKAGGHPSMDMMRGPMFQALLEDRFKLKIHLETQQGPVYDLTLASGSSRLQPFKEGSCVQLPLTRPFPAPPSGQHYCMDRVGLKGSIDAEGKTLTEFGKLLNLVLDRPVVDKTGLTAKFDMHLEFARDEAAPKLLPFPELPAQPPSDSGKPTIFTAIQEQLGLKLTSSRGPVECLVIDHIERPSEN
jgi:uncharacterized protein (TIGR03435 family)